MPQCVVIDTNIFIHMFNPSCNPDSRIEQFLINMTKNNAILYVDNHGKARSEYKKHLTSRLEKADDMDILVHILRYWMSESNQSEVEIDLQGELLNSIKKIIPSGRCHKDRFFVAIAATVPCFLYTHDNNDILGNRIKLRKITRKWHKGDMDICAVVNH